MNKLRQVIEKDYKVEGALRQEVNMNIKRLMDTAAIAACATVAACPSAGSARTRTRAPKGSASRYPGQEEGYGEEVARKEHKERHGEGSQDEEEVPCDRGRGRRAHPGDVQQHADHDQRHAGQRDHVGLGGQERFKAWKKSTPFAAQIAAENCAREALSLGLKRVHVRVQGPGPRESAIQALQAAGLDPVDQRRHPDPHNGCRPPKRRRV